MDITTRLEGDEMHVVLRGRLDAAWSGTVHKALQDTVHGGCHRIALDLAQVDYLSSAGIRIMVLLAKNLKAIGGSLRLSDASPQVSEVLKLVGFEQLLQPFAAAAPAGASSAVQDEAPLTARNWQLGGTAFEVYDLHPEAVQQGRIIAAGEAPAAMQMHADAWAIGQGALGSAAGQAERAGELLAVDGLALALPGDDPQHPDWLLREGDLEPEVALYHGLAGQGEFRHLLRFGVAPEAPALPLSELAQATLALCGSDCAVLAMLAETAQLVGAARQVPPAAGGEDFFAFPALRDRLLFTAEPAYADETCLVVGVVARAPAMALAAQVRPLAADSDLHLHLHAAVVPFSPVRKGLIELHSSLQKFIDSQTVRGVLHLLNDDRDGVGAGESVLRRGALWCAPLEFKETSL
ncbi:MAG: STAS domain-containing protein [Gammaproteobacteria bacterium]